MGNYHSTNKKSPKKPLLIAGGVIVLILVLGYFGYTRYENSKPKVSPEPKPTITSLPQSDKTIENKDVTSNTSHSSSIGGATDNNGADTSTATPSSSWTTSQSGVITVKSPVTNQAIASGAKLIGTAKTPQVKYRLTDDKVGVISQGTVSVVNGNFSATINFTTQGKSGRLDVFTTDENDKELNEVQLPVSFN